MKIIFLDNDGVICLENNWGSRYKKSLKYSKSKMVYEHLKPVDFRFDNFDDKAIKVLNEIISETDCEIVVSSDWRLHATLEELGEYYLSQGIIKKPIGYTPTAYKVPKEFEWGTTHELEKSRGLEILEYLKNNPEITQWVAVDDLDMSMMGEYGLTNFVRTPNSREGIKQSGIKEKIKKYLTKSLVD